MALALRLGTDLAPVLTPLDGLTVRRERDAAIMAALQGRPRDAMAARFDDGHRAYVASVDGIPAAFGWVATRSAAIGEFGMRFTLPRGERYLWNFVTLPTHRGRGIYPRLLDVIVQREARWGARFWIAYAPENHASGAGIRKAGFDVVADFSIAPSGEVAVRDRLPGGGKTAGALLGLAESTVPLAPCWHCGRASGLTSSCGRGPGCTCDYQNPERGCHSTAPHGAAGAGNGMSAASFKPVA